MNINKIDRRLLNEIAILSQDKKLPCLVFSKNLDNTRQVLNNRKIHIIDEYELEENNNRVSESERREATQVIDEIRNNLLTWIKRITKNGFWAIQIPDSPPDNPYFFK